MFLENPADINSFKHTTLSLIYESNFFRVVRICVAECIFDFVKRDTVFSQHCNLFTQEQCHMFCETRKSYLTAYLRFHLGDIHREDIWQYHSTGNIDGHSAIISEILSYTRIFGNTTGGRNCDGRCHLFLLVVFYWNKYSFVSMRIFTLTRFLKRNSVLALRGADKHADRWSIADMDFSLYSSQVFCLNTWIRCVWSGFLESCTEVWQHSLFYFWKDVYIYSRTCSTGLNLPSWSISFLYLCVIPSAGWNRGRVIITYCLIYIFLAPVW